MGRFWVIPKYFPLESITFGLFREFLPFAPVVGRRKSEKARLPVGRQASLFRLYQGVNGRGDIGGEIYLCFQ
jgi:hypothetical protein